MKYEKVAGTTHIHVEKGEDTKKVLQAIVKASYDLALPAVRRSIQEVQAHYDKNRRLTDEEVDEEIYLPPLYSVGKLVGEELDDRPVVRMHHLNGRECVTVICWVQDEEGHFILKNDFYEKDRGLPEPILERAKEILLGNESEVVIATTYMFKGGSLSRRLKKYGYFRRNGENDWSFRKRVFPHLYKQQLENYGDPLRATEFLFGASVIEWKERNKLLWSDFMHQTGDEPTEKNLRTFAERFGADPQPLIEKHR